MLWFTPSHSFNESCQTQQHTGHRKDGRKSLTYPLIFLENVQIDFKNQYSNTFQLSSTQGTQKMEKKLLTKQKR